MGHSSRLPRRGPVRCSKTQHLAVRNLEVAAGGMAPAGVHVRQVLGYYSSYWCTPGGCGRQHSAGGLQVWLVRFGLQQLVHFNSVLIESACKARKHDWAVSLWICR